MNFSWRNETQPGPPSPDFTCIFTSSMKLIFSSDKQQKPGTDGSRLLQIYISFCSAGGVNRNLFPVPSHTLELHHPFDKGEEGVVLAQTHVVARVDLGAMLTIDDVAALTCSPPNFLQPSLWPSESRPFLELPTPFLCAIFYSSWRLHPFPSCGDRFIYFLGVDLFDLQNGSELTVPVKFPGIFPALGFEDENLLIFALLDYFADHRGAGH